MLGRFLIIPIFLRKIEFACKIIKSQIIKTKVHKFDILLRI